MRTVNYKYDIGERVRIIDVEAFGRVDSLSTDIRGELYRVVFWMNGNRQNAWMYDWELEPIKNKQE